MNGAQFALDIGYADAGMAGNRFGFLASFLPWRNLARTFQRVLRRDHPPNLSQLKVLERRQRYGAVALVGGIERSAKQPDSPSAHVKAAMLTAGIGRCRARCT